MPSWPWYLDGSGQIGPLRTISGSPPVGVEAINPTPQWGGCSDEGSYLVEAGSDRVWHLETIAEIPADGCDAQVVAQDKAGVQWVEATDSHRPEALTLWWRAPGEQTWHRRDFETPPYNGELLYSGSTIGIPGASGRADKLTLQVSTDRGHTWTTRPLGQASDFGARWSGGFWDLHFMALPDGALVAFVNGQLAEEQPDVVAHLVRSTDAGWTTFQRTADIPPGRWYPPLGQAIGFCEPDFECHVSHDAGDSWRTLTVPPL